MPSFMRTVGVAIALAQLIMAAPTAWALDPERQLSQLHHTAWTIRDGMPFAGINAVAQTPDGFLWLASYIGGLHRFDGVQAVPVAAEQLRDREINFLVTDHRGDLWMGFAGTPAIARLSRDGLRIFEVPTTGIKAFLLSIVPDPDGSVWVATRDKVHHFDGERWKVLDDPWPLTSTAFSDPGGVWAMAVARDGTVWSKNLLGLYYLRRGASAFEQAEGYAGGMFDFATDSQGRLWTSDFSTTRFYSLPDLIPGKPVGPPLLGGVVPKFMAGVLRADRDGTLWNANRVTGFLYRAASFDSPGTADRFTTRDGLTAEFPGNVLEDREGNIWITTSLGLDRFRNAAIASVPGVSIRAQAAAMVATRDALFVYSGMRAPVPDPDGDPGGRLIRIRQGQRPEIVEDNIGQVTAIDAAADDSIIFSRQGELFRWREGVTTRIATPPELAGAHVVNLSATADGLVVSFYQKGVHRLSAGTWANITAAWATPQDTASIATDAQGAAWLLYWNERIVRVGREGTQEFRSPIGKIRAALPDRDGMILVGASGIARYEGRGLQTISMARAPILDLAFGIEQSDDGDIWIGRGGGIVRLNRAALLNAFARSDAPLSYELFDDTDSFTGSVSIDTFNGLMTEGPDGRIWTFMRSGVGWIDPKRQYRNTQPPPVVITSVAAQRQRYEMPLTLSLPAGTSQLEIDYSAPSLTVPERIRFRYKLEGVDEDWVDAGSRRQAFYTSLPPGEHRFRVIAANEDEVWNEEGATLVFTIAPTFLQSIWFKLLLGMVIGLLLWLMYRVLLKQQAARLHKRFEIRIAERERIARELHDTLLQGVQSLILRFDAVAARVPSDSELHASTQEALRRAEVVVAQGRDRVRELRTTSKADLGQAILEVSREIIHEDAPRLTLTEKGPSRVLHAVVRDEMVLIAGEAIRNAVHHARSTALAITLDFGDAELLMSIHDDGIGFPQEVLTHAEKPGHYGLVGMRERAQRIGGRLRIQSREDAGTVVALTVPARAAYIQRQGFLKRFLGRESSQS